MPQPLYWPDDLGGGLVNYWEVPLPDPPALAPPDATPITSPSTAPPDPAAPAAPPPPPAPGLTPAAGLPANTWAAADAALQRQPAAPAEAPLPPPAPPDPKLAWPTDVGGGLVDPAAAARAGAGEQGFFGAPLAKPIDPAALDKAVTEQTAPTVAAAQTAQGAVQKNYTAKDVLDIADPAERYARWRGLESQADKQAVVDALTPEAAADLQVRHDAERENLVAADRIKADLAAKQDAERQARAHEHSVIQRQRALDDLNAESLRLAGARIDNDRWWRDGGTTRKIGAGIMAIVGGFMQSRAGGGRNFGLDMIDKAIDQDIEAQKADLVNRRGVLAERRGIVGEQFARLRDVNEAADVARIASRDRAIAELQQRAAAFDPRGTMALSINRSVRELEARNAKAKLDYLEKKQKIAHDEEKLRLDREQQAETARANRAREAGAAAERGLTGARLSFDQRKHVDDTQLKREEIDAKKTEKQQEREDKAADNVLKFGMYGPNTATVDAAGTPSLKPGPSLIQADGKTQFEIRDPELRRNAIEAMDSAERVTSIIDEILAIRDRVGGESTTFNSDDAQRLKVLGNELVLLKKKGTQGMSSDSDMVRIEESLGANDVTSFRARAAGLEKAREVVEKNINSKLNKAGYSGTAVAFPNAYKNPAPTLTPEQEALKRLRSRPGVSVETAEREELQRLQDTTAKDSPDGNGWKASTWRSMLGEAKQRAAQYKDIAPDQRRKMDDLAGLAHGTTPEAEKARAELSALVTDGGTELIRDAARAALESAGLGSAGSRERLPGAQ